MPVSYGSLKADRPARPGNQERHNEMCGIAGVFHYGDDSGDVHEGDLLRSRDSMRMRGPDGAGIWVSPSRKVGLANRRLAIMDLSSAGAQPMASRDARLWAVYNGEIYNYHELRARLEREGVELRTRCDTEILLHLYARDGREMVRHLRGMYAFVIWDD